MHASLLGFCLESLIIDNDIIGATQRIIRGIEVSDDTLSLETIRDACIGGPGHYLGSDQTLRADADATMSIRPSATARARRNGREQGSHRHHRQGDEEDEGDPGTALSAAMCRTWSTT